MRVVAGGRHALSCCRLISWVITPSASATSTTTPSRAWNTPGTAHRTIAGLIQPTGLTFNLEPGRTALVTTWRLFTTSPVTARDRILWQGRIFQVTGQPSQWSRSGQPSQWR
jgi:hypothetical protein